MGRFIVLNVTFKSSWLRTKIKEAVYVRLVIIWFRQHKHAKDALMIA